jgi:ABC-2 type transport system permease protein
LKEKKMSSPNTSRFATLILREWMQHKRGWLITMLLPPIIFLVVLPFGQVHGLPIEHPLPIALIIMLASTIGVFGVSYTGAMFQLPGLARRDQQDRSIEFWLSLPAGHGESIGATLVTHALLVPLVAALVGFAFGAVIAPGLIAKQGGLAALASVPWFSVLAVGLPALLRGLLGVILMSLWLAPLMLIVMAASAWLKRWGVPAVAIVVGIGGTILAKVYDMPVVWDLLQAQLQGASRALLAEPDALRDQLQQLETSGTAFHAAGWALKDALTALADLGSPHLVGGLIVAAACFGLLVLKRSRSA